MTDLTLHLPDGRTVLRVPFGHESVNRVSGGQRCPDCQVIRGQRHHHGCPMEQCPRCSLQLVTCGCIDDHETQHQTSNARSHSDGEEPTGPQGGDPGPEMLGTGEGCASEVRQVQNIGLSLIFVRSMAMAAPHDDANGRAPDRNLPRTESGAGGRALSVNDNNQEA